MRRSCALVFLVVLATLALLPSCSGTLTELCQREKDCSGGNDKDVDACVALLNGAEDAADAYDCGDAFTKNVDCLKEKALCKEGKIDTDPCKTEAEAVDACTRAASAKAKK